MDDDSSGSESFIRNIAKTVLIAALVAFILRIFVLQTVRVEGRSMEPALRSGEIIFVNKLVYHFKAPSQGDIIIFYPPIKSLNRYPYIKRVIGVEGQVVSIKANSDHSEAIFIDGRELEEPYLKKTPHSFVINKWKLGKGEVFVLGDNRNNSSDSRWWGPINEKSIIGKASLVWWPLCRFRFLRGEEEINGD
jgi:signal peptidase I